MTTTTTDGNVAPTNPAALPSELAESREQSPMDTKDQDHEDSSSLKRKSSDQETAKEEEPSKEEDIREEGGAGGEPQAQSQESLAPHGGDGKAECNSSFPERILQHPGVEAQSEDKNKRMKIEENHKKIDGNPRKIEEDPKEEEETPHPLWKTSLCSFYRRGNNSGVCSHGDSCRYAHGESELRPRPDNTWDPTSQRAKNNNLIPDEDDHDDDDGDAGIRLKDAVGLCGDNPDTDCSAFDKCIIGLPRKWTSDKFEAFLRDRGVSYKTAKKKKGMTVAFIGFKDAEQLQNALMELNGQSIGGGKDLKLADVKSHAKKHTDDHADINSSHCEGLTLNTKSARDAATSLAHMSYNEQLEYKKNSVLQTLKKLTRNARKACPDSIPLPEWIRKSRDLGGLPCELVGILPSPLRNGYRNKCEFSVGYSPHGKKTVGFTVGNFRDGVVAVEEPVNCPNLSRISVKYALIFQDFLQSSALPVWNRLNNTGFWRQFTVREGRDPDQAAIGDNLEANIAEVMLIIQVCTKDVDAEIMKSEFRRMSQYIAQCASACSPHLPLNALVIQDHQGMSNVAPVDCPLFSLPIPKAGVAHSENNIVTEGRIHDYICSLKFCISPTAFFQVNTLAAEQLYSLAGDWACLTPKTLLFDICCGTGTIGLTLAHRVGMVVGIEMNGSAVSDAQRNADINCIKNCRFICAKAEAVMGKLLKEYLNDPLRNSTKSNDSVSSDAMICSKGNSNDFIGNAKHDSSTEDTSSTICEVEACDSVSMQTGGTKSNDCVSSDAMICSKGNSNDFIGNAKHDSSTEDTCSRICKVEECDSVSTQTGGNQINNDKSYLPCLKNCTSMSKEASQENCISEESEGVTVQQYEDVVAIVDPPRGGLHPVVIKALRTHPRLRRLVYISCNPESLAANAIELCTPATGEPQPQKGNKMWWKMSIAGLARNRAKSMPISEPFRPVKAMAVDLFPHTPHCEMVMLFER